MTKLIHLSGADTSLLMHIKTNEIPSIIYWGKKLINNIDKNNLNLIIDRPIPQAFLDDDVTLSLLPEEGRGFFATPGLRGESNRKSWTTQFIAKDIKSTATSVRICCEDKLAGLELIINISLINDILQVSNKIINKNSKPYNLHDLALTLPIPERINELMSFHGRWIQEFKTLRHKWINGTYSRENRRGRTSPDNIPYLIAGTDGFKETSGEVYGFHLAWSGNSRYNATTMTDGRKFVQFSELLLPGEILLNQNECYETPILYTTYSAEGLNKMSENFHSFLRNDKDLIKRKREKQPVHFNTWEAVYFDHKRDKLFNLVDRAADIGVERFILDDGWFPGRNGEKAGLGDWYIDKNKYPEGLSPLIEYVEKKGMEFGLWFEPEMINPDSNLFRSHPDWILSVENYKQYLGRYQYVLNLSNPDAFNYIFERIDSLLAEYNIKYIKWDMNRDLSQPGNNLNHPSIHNQVKSLYKLLKKLEEKHPEVAIESCSSGGARIDFAILKHTNRVWTSDCNDALERQNIQKGFSYFLPPEIMGSHFGPSPAHTTQRQTSLKFRFLTCFFGHLGFEQDVLSLTDEERESLKHYVQLHKKYRNIIHNSKYFRMDTCDSNLNGYGVVNSDKSIAIISLAQLSMPEFMIPEKIRIPYLKKETNYKVTVIDRPPVCGNLMKKEPAWMDKEISLTGELLEQIGIQLPVMDPESIILLELRAI